jgi:signal transduction histidine kinase
MLTIAKRRNQLISESRKHKKLEKSLVETLEKAQLANNEKDLFLTNMSHELRTPLNIIIGFSDALKLDITGPLNEKQRGFVENIHFAGNRLLNLINDLLDLSNIESGNLPPDLEKIRLRDLLSNHVKDLMRHANNYGITLNVIDDLDEIEGLVYVHGNNDWIAQILMALTDNAAKYGNKNGNIWINAFQNDKDTIRITVKDEGHGIAENEIKNVFKPFNRAGVDSKAIEGTGAGLTIVKGLVDAMNGNIDFTTQYGSGTTFWIDLPIKSI